MKKLISILLLAALMLWAIPCTASAAPKGDVWDGVTITEPSKQVLKDGKYYYEISKCSELAFVAQTGGKWLYNNYILTNDLILNDKTITTDEDGNISNMEDLSFNSWKPIGNDEYNYYSGIFDGDNHTISGVFGYNGLFGYIGNGPTDVSCMINNLHVANSYVNGFGKRVGGIVGHCNSGYINSCTFDGVVKSNGTCVGGIVGSSQGSISGCTNNGKVFGSNQIGGIVGYGVYCKVNTCLNRGTVFGNGDVGGISGKNEGSSGCSINSCINFATVSGSQATGGIIGNATNCNITYCVNRGNVSSETEIGGIAGTTFKSIVSNSYNTGLIEGSNNVSGGVGIVKSSTIEDSYNVGSVSGDDNYGPIIGGFSGYENTITGCYFLKSDSPDIIISDASNSKGITTNEFKQDTSFGGWDFTNIWTISSSINNGYPCLVWEKTASLVPKTSISPSISLKGIIINPLSSAEYYVGQTFSLSVSPNPEGASLPSLKWTSSNNKVASVDKNGQVTTVGPGDVIITVSGGGYSASCSFTVKGGEEPAKVPYSLGKLTIRTESGSSLSAIPNDSFLVTIPVTKQTDSGDAMVLLASYTASGQYRGLLYVELEDVPVGSTVKATLLVENNSKDIKQLKAFVTSGFGSFTPLGEASVFPA